MTAPTRSKKRGRLAIAGAGLSFALSLSGCAGFGNLGNPPGVTTITLASVNNPQMQDMNRLLPEFQKLHPEIKVNIIFLEEGDLRNATTQDVATGGGQYDIMTVGMYEVPIWGQNKWLLDLTDKAAQDPTYDVDDLFAPVRTGVSYNDRLYALPFYGESSFLMYRKDLFEQAGLQMPERPTWEQVAAFAKQLKTNDRAGICLRGKPGWGDLFASMTTVVNTFGGQWYDTDWNAKLTSPEWKEAVSFYLNTLKESGEADPASFSFTECLDLFSTSRAAMWYDATSAAGSVESADEVKGKVGYVYAPTKLTANSGWLWSWNLGINAKSDPASQDAAWQFVKWATSKDYLKLVGSQLGWARTPPGTRKSTYEIPEYVQAGGEFAPLTAKIMSEVDPAKPGVNPQPWTGIQYVSIPEFQDVGNQVSQEIVDAIAGRQTVDQALEAGQRIAERAGEQQKENG